MSLVAPIHVTKQHVHVSVETEPFSIKGYTDIDIAATTSNPPPVIFLNARQVKIDKVTNMSPGGKEVPFEYVDSHASLLFKKGPLVRDASQFVTVAQIVTESPDLIIHYQGMYPVTFRIEFHVNENSTSIVREQGIVLTDNRVDGPSGWFPCMDTYGQRSMFSLTVEHSQALLCLGPGESNIMMDPQTKRAVTIFRIHYPVQAWAVGFVVGPFSPQPVEGLKSSWMYYTGGIDVEVYKQTLRPVLEVQKVLCSKFDFLGDPADTALTFVSLPFLTEPMMWPGVIFIPVSMYCPVGNVNIIYKVVPQLVELLVGQLIYFLFPVSDHRDRWIQVGLCGLLTDIITGSDDWYSSSWRLDKRWQELNWLMVEDIHESVVLRALDPVTGEPFRDPYLKVKAKMLMNMITTSLKNRELRLIALMIPLMKQSMEPNSGFVADRFMQDVTKFCSINFKRFKEQWLMSNGFPIFTYNFTNDTRHNNLKMVLAQTPSAKTRVPFFTGQMLIHLQDLEQPYEHQFAVENEIQQQQMNYFAHRRKTKNKDFTFENGKTQKVVVHHAVMWIIIDEPMAWICRVRPRVPEFMLLYQLQLNRNVFWLHEAVSSLEDFKDSEKTIERMEDMLKNEDLFYGVRGHVARALAKFANEETDFKHMMILRDWYVSQFFTVQNGKEILKPHDFDNVPQHFLQLECIKALSIIRDSHNVTPLKVVTFLITIMESANNNSNTYNDDYYVAEGELALGRMRPESDDPYLQAETIIRSKLDLHAEVPSIGDIISSAGYTALTAIALKTECVKVDTNEMRSVVLKNTNYYEARATLFRNLLFLALAGNHGVTFKDLFADIRWLATEGTSQGNPGYLEFAAMCLREVYRFVLNSVREGEEDKFQVYLLALPEEKDLPREKLVKIITGGEHKLEIAETLWELLTVHGQHHKILRSEAYRAYVTLYGDKLPYPYDEKKLSQPQMELMADRSGGCILQIDAPRVPTRAASTANLAREAAAPRKMVIKFTDGTGGHSQSSMPK